MCRHLRIGIGQVPFLSSLSTTAAAKSGSALPFIDAAMRGHKLVEQATLNLTHHYARRPRVVTA